MSFKKFHEKFSCRAKLLTKLVRLLGHPKEIFPSALNVYGNSGTGKTMIIKEFLLNSKHLKIRSVYINCVEVYNLRTLFELILKGLLNTDLQGTRYENSSTFLNTLKQADMNFGYIVVLDSAERLRDLDSNILCMLLRLAELTPLNISVVLISQLPFEKYFSKSSTADILSFFFSQYTQLQTKCILKCDFVYVQRYLCDMVEQMAIDLNEKRRRIQIINDTNGEFFNNYLNLFLSVFFKVCRNISELKITARKYFSVYMEPILDGSIQPNDISRLWRYIAVHLRTALTQVYIRFDESIDSNACDVLNQDQHQLFNPSVRTQAQCLELPYYAKFLLIAAFLASYNSAKEDKRLFVKHHGTKRKRAQTINTKAKVSNKMTTLIGPKSFSIDRFLAIFYAIIDEKVGLTCNLLTQISSLLRLKLINYMSGENHIVDGSTRLQCTLSLEFISFIGKVVDFNIRQYLCDFM